MFCGSHWGGHYYISETQAGICSQVDVSKTASCWLDPGYVSQSGRKESVKSVAKTPASQAVSQLSHHLALTEEDHSRAEQITELCACFTVQETRDLPHEKTRQPGEPPCLEAVFRELQKGWRNLASGLYYRTALSHCTHSNGVRDVRPGGHFPGAPQIQDGGSLSLHGLHSLREESGGTYYGSLQPHTTRGGRHSVKSL